MLATISILERHEKACIYCLLQHQSPHSVTRFVLLLYFHTTITRNGSTGLRNPDSSKQRSQVRLQ
jgi:hypothetical protein